MTPKFSPLTSDAIKLVALHSDDLKSTFNDLPDVTANWLRNVGFDGGIGACAVVPNTDGSLNEAFVGLGAKGQNRARFTIASV